ncbi:hypothetical protein ABW21_db0202820 [Orbilia brochopaga]|nr:hypothetical protein ABW21_db0202820 [Drechslerella brochopaga]
METQWTPAEDGAIPLRDWVIFMPSPISEGIQAELSYKDSITLTRVCRTWRRYLIPDDSGGQNISGTDSDAQWHPLVRTIAVPRMSAGKQRYFYDTTLYGNRRGPFKQEYRSWGLGDPLPELQRVFGQNYGDAITRVYLDGAIINTYHLSDRSNLIWLQSCPNLTLLSLRWCSGIDLTDLVQFFIHGQVQLGQIPDIDAGDKILPKLRTLYVWGIYGTMHMWQTKDRLKAGFASLLRKYHMDIDWCPEPVHDDADYGSTPRWMRDISDEKRRTR